MWRVTQGSQCRAHTWTHSKIHTFQPQYYRRYDHTFFYDFISLVLFLQVTIITPSNVSGLWLYVSYLDFTHKPVLNPNNSTTTNIHDTVKCRKHHQDMYVTRTVFTTTWNLDRHVHVIRVLHVPLLPSFRVIRCFQEIHKNFAFCKILLFWRN